MSPQEKSLELLFDIAKRRADPSLLQELVIWAKHNLKTRSAVLDIGKPIGFCDWKEQLRLKRRLMLSFAEGLTSQNYDSYVEGEGNTLVMRVLMLGSDAKELQYSEARDLIEEMTQRLLPAPVKELTDEHA